MTNTRNKWHRLAGLLRTYPWIMGTAYRVARIAQSKYTIGVVGVMFDSAERVLLVEHVFHPKMPWGLPGGWINHREDPKRAIQREIDEELELEVAVGEVLLAEFHHGNHLDLAYICQPKGAIGSLSYELLRHEWFQLDRLPHLRVFHSRAIQQALRERSFL